MGEATGAAGGYATETKTGRHVCEREGQWCVMDGDRVCSRHDTQAEAEWALANPEPAEDTGTEPVDRTAPLPALPEGLKTYTTEEIASLIGRRVFDPMFAILDRRLRDADDLARGRV